MIDAIRSTGAEFRIFPHNGIEKLQRLLSDATSEQVQVVVTESIFSMDGDAADLAGIAELKKRYPFVLVLDEAHGSGLYGADGSGYAAERGFNGIVDVSIVTLSKALGCAGGAICGSVELIDAVANFGRAWIYSSSIPPMLAAAAREAICVMKEEPWRQQRLRANAKRVREELKIVCDGTPADSPIVPVILGMKNGAQVRRRVLKGRGFG